MTTVTLTQQFSVDEQVPENLLLKMQRLEQTRMRVLETTRAYLGTNSQSRVNTQERRGDVSESQKCQSQGRTGVEGSSSQVPQKSDPQVKDWGERGWDQQRRCPPRLACPRGSLMQRPAMVELHFRWDLAWYRYRVEVC
ncbi:uncharacterized protein Z519_03673 [Cladophialophora bantiana CBS 173.52]|uniref:Uncharacterized protein n=1 Tax=Cladophialophora bantiana (strain ATCC 10958 / CBS 173.52 / CDC B-1940 / NIH 8579) TaxID=1442370 RepID=A0A0D2IE81_CLAB1|nr:uncharacterized protein Z519_03673 [Cladophialophora bantiana CBS 173.52]KIW95089.1 hypothetical protein Z519_03673 [Cladophialophora bantiana CBS 173.52]